MMAEAKMENVNPHLLIGEELDIYRRNSWVSVADITKLLLALCEARRLQGDVLEDINAACNDDEQVNHAPRIGMAVRRLQRARLGGMEALTCKTCGAPATGICERCDQHFCGAHWRNDWHGRHCLACYGEIYPEVMADA